jgi:hypothetical protein
MSIAIYIVAAVIGIPVALVAVVCLIQCVLKGFVAGYYYWWWRPSTRRFLIKQGVTPAEAEKTLNRWEKKWLAEIHAEREEEIHAEREELPSAATGDYDPTDNHSHFCLVLFDKSMTMATTARGTGDDSHRFQCTLGSDVYPCSRSCTRDDGRWLQVG